MIDSCKFMFQCVLMKAGRVPGPSKDGGTLLALLRGAGLGLLVLSGLTANAFSQTPPSSRSYRIVVGDVLQIDVAGRADISGQYSVDKDGGVKLPVLGVVTAEARTTTELGTDISRRISLISRDIPQVTVSVLQAYRRKNFVLGAVLLPGSYTFAKSPSVWDAISAAGGASDDANLSAVQVISEGQMTPSIVDLATVIQKDELASLPRLRPGDTVRVPRREVERVAAGDVVFVFGAVALQGSQPLSESSDLVRALIRSGPAINADLAKVEIVRRSGSRVVSMRVNMKDYLGNASVVGNPQLLPGDTIYLPSGRGGSNDYLRIAGVVLGFVTTVVLLTNNY